MRLYLLSCFSITLFLGISFLCQPRQLWTAYLSFLTKPPQFFILHRRNQNTKIRFVIHNQLVNKLQITQTFLYPAQHTWKYYIFIFISYLHSYVHSHLHFILFYWFIFNLTVPFGPSATIRSLNALLLRWKALAKLIDQISVCLRIYVCLKLGFPFSWFSCSILITFAWFSVNA